MKHRTRTRALLLWTAVLACLLGTPTAWAVGDCEAGVYPEMARKESGSEVGATGPRFTWQVEITTQAECAKIRFELEATVQTEDGENVIRRKPGQVKLSDSETMYKMVLNLNAGEELSEWKIELTHCTPCTLFAP